MFKSYVSQLASLSVPSDMTKWLISIHKLTYSDKHVLSQSIFGDSAAPTIERLLTIYPVIFLINLVTVLGNYCVI